MDQNDRLFGHDRWMTEHLRTLCSGLSDEEWDREFDVGHKTLRASWLHTIGTYDWWRSQMESLPLEDWEPEAVTYEVLLARHHEAYDRFENFARSAIADGRLDETFVDHWQVEHSIGASILHVILHNHNHRTEILHIMQRLGMDDLPEGDPQEWEWELRRQGSLPPAS